jgi:dihydrofolate reductase
MKSASGPTVAFVLARAENGVIGNKGGLPWRLPGDLRRFKALTMGKPVIMGRKTYEGIGGPLPGRDNVVVSRDPTYRPPGVFTAAGLETALELARRLADERDVKEIMVIGGAEIFEASLSRAARIYLTEIHARIPGDTVLSDFNADVWQEKKRERQIRGEKDSHDYSFVLLERRR